MRVLQTPHSANATQLPQAARFFPVLVIAATVFAGLLRFYGLDRQELWLDESCTYYFVHQVSPFDFQSKPLLYENASRLYYMLLAGWTSITGPSAWGLRSFSAVLGTLTVPLIAFWLRSTAGHLPAILAALITAVHPLHVHYSREARFYPLWMIEIICLLWCAHWAVRTGKKRYWAGYALLWLCSLWTHYFTVYFVPIVFCLPLLKSSSPWRWRYWLVSHVCIAAAFAPWFIHVVIPVSGRGNSDWIAKYFWKYPPAAAIPKTFAAFAPGGFYPDTLGELKAVTDKNLLPSVIGILVFVAAGASFFCSSSIDRGTRIFWGGAVLIPLFLAWMYSLLRSPIYHVARYDQVVWPAAMTILAWGLSLLIRRLQAARLLAILCGILPVTASAAVSVQAVEYSMSSSSPTQDLLGYLRTLYRPGDRVISLGMSKWHMRYYMDTLWPNGPEIQSFPAAIEGQVGWDSPRRHLAAPQALAREAARQAISLKSEMKPGTTVWIILSGLSDASLGIQDPAFQVNIHIIKALEEAGAIDRPTDPDRQILALSWPISPESSPRFTP